MVAFWLLSHCRMGFRLLKPVLFHFHLEERRAVIAFACAVAKTDANRLWSVQPAEFGYATLTLVPWIAEMLSPSFARNGSESGFTFNEVLLAMNVIVIAVLGYSAGTGNLVRWNSGKRE